MPDTPPPDLRVYFAGERTTLAWVRTGLAMMGFGFVVARFGLFLRELAASRAATTAAVPLDPHPGRMSLGVGVALCALGVVVNVYAAVRHARFTRQYDAGSTGRPSAGMPVVAALVLAAVGVFVTGYLLLVR